MLISHSEKQNDGNLLLQLESSDEGCFFHDMGKIGPLENEIIRGPIDVEAESHPQLVL